MAKAKSKKWLGIAGIVAAAVVGVGSIVGLSIKLDRQTTVKTIGSEAYSIGVLTEEGKISEVNTAIILEDRITTKGLTCTLKEDAKITYQLFFYDKDDKFISASDVLSTDFDGTGTPEGAKYARVMITPTADEDGKVSIFEKGGYAKQLTVRVDK